MTRSARRLRAEADAAPAGEEPRSRTSGHDDPRVREIALAAERDAARAARAFSRDTLRQWERGELIDDALLVVSELVTNAVLHGVPVGFEGEDEGAGDGKQPIMLQLVNQMTSVLCIVRDPSSTPPRVVGGQVLDETCRGLRIVAEVSTAWGWTPCGQQRGKTVWAVLDVAPRPLGALVVGGAAPASAHPGDTQEIARQMEWSF